MDFDLTVTLGNVFQIVTFVATAFITYHAAMLRLKGLEDTLRQHGVTLSAHAERMDRYETMLVSTIGELKLTIGRIEGSRERTAG